MSVQLQKIKFFNLFEFISIFQFTSYIQQNIYGIKLNMRRTMKSRRQWNEKKVSNDCIQIKILYEISEKHIQIKKNTKVISFNSLNSCIEMSWCQNGQQKSSRVNDFGNYI